MLNGNFANAQFAKSWKSKCAFFSNGFVQTKHVSPPFLLHLCLLIQIKKYTSFNMNEYFGYELHTVVPRS